MPFLRSCQLTTQYSNSETLVLLAQLKGPVKQKPRLARIVTWRLKWSLLEDVTPKKLMFTVLVNLDVANGDFFVVFLIVLFACLLFS